MLVVDSLFNVTALRTISVGILAPEAGIQMTSDAGLVEGVVNVDHHTPYNNEKVTTENDAYCDAAFGATTIHEVDAIQGSPAAGECEEAEERAAGLCGLNEEEDNNTTNNLFKSLDELSSDQLDLDENDATGTDRVRPGAHERAPNTTKYYHQSEYPISFPPRKLTHHTNVNRVLPSSHHRQNSCDNSITSKLHDGGKDFDTLQDGDALNEADAVQDLHDFLGSYYNLPEGMDSLVGAPDPTYSTGPIYPSSTFDSMQDREKREGRKVHGVIQGRIQKKISNPLHGALQAAMAASSSHTFQCDPIPYEPHHNHNDAAAHNAFQPGQDDMCTPQSQFRQDGGLKEQQREACHDHGLERRHSYHFTYSNNQHEAIYHGSPIGMSYEKRKHAAYERFAVQHNALQQQAHDNMWRQKQIQGLRRSISANTNTNSSSHFNTPSMESLRQTSSNCKTPSTITLSSNDRLREADANKSSSSDKNSGGARGPRGSSSRYRGVTQHRRTKRWEAHVWDKGKQVYLGGFESEHRAGRAYDVVVLKTRGADRCQTNFPVEEYAGVIPYLNSVTRDELVLLLRRRSKGFSRGSSKYVGVTKHKCGKWEARISNANKTINAAPKQKRNDVDDLQGSQNLHQGTDGGQQQGNVRKYTYLGLYETELEAARAHDKAAVALFGLHAHTNFDVCSYPDELLLHKPGMKEMGMLKLFQGTNQLLY